MRLDSSMIRANYELVFLFACSAFGVHWNAHQKLINGIFGENWWENWISPTWLIYIKYKLCEAKSGQNECSARKLNRISFVSSMNHAFRSWRRNVKLSSFFISRWNTECILLKRQHTEIQSGIEIWQSDERIGQIERKHLVRIAWMQQHSKIACSLVDLCKV